MGHHLGSKDSIVPLIDRLNKYPVGLVDNEKLREILALLFDEQEAFIASCFPLEEATLQELVRATGIAAPALTPLLDKMADKGLVMDMPYGGKTYYLLMPGLIGFFEFTFMKNRADLPLAELARLMAEYMYENPQIGQASEFFGSKTSLTRSLVYADQIPVSSTVTSYEDARQIIESSSFGAVGMCYCRHKKEHLDATCAKGAPVENICISLGSAARFMARRGFAREQSKAELLAILDTARTHNLTHITDNIRHQPSFICNCCSCCCELMLGSQAGYQDGIGKTPFLAQVDKDACNGCGLCFAACNVKALTPASCSEKAARYADLDEPACLGCGACIPVCKCGALSLVERAERPLPPEKRRDMLKAILKEKGRLKPYVISGIKKKLRRLLPGS
ncbi:MAG: 4Fe-4S binding protein [Desulfuromonadales bacterium]|nr:4Fe-4S binding protein [Desulfuromonadales bacterium]